MNSKTILLVEDEAIIALIHKKTLGKYGFNVITADTGEKAVEIADSTPEIDLILMDINLGEGIDGTEAAERILENHDIPLVFLSSHTEPEVVEKTEGITSYGYVVKNSGETVLIASIRMAFRLFDAKLNAKVKEKALLASEERFSHLFQRAPLGYQSLDENGYFLDVNEAWLETLGYERGEVIGKWFGDFLAPDFVDLFKTNFSLFKKAGKIHSEFEMINKSGKILFIAFDGRIGRKEDGSVDQTHCILQDVTERNSLQEKLRLSDRIFNHSIDMLCIAGFDGYFKFLNPAWEKTLGWSNDELMSRPWVEFVHPDDRGDTENIGTVLVDGKEIYQFENRYICKDGSVKWLSWNSFPYPDEGVMFGVARDITGKKNEEQAKKENEENLKRAQSMAKLGSWSIDLNKDIAIASKETAAIYGLEGDQWSVDTIQSVPLPQYREALNKKLTDLIKNNKPYDVEFQIRRPSDNGVRYIHSIAEYDATENRVVGTIQDITDRKMIEEELLKERALLKMIMETSPVGITTVDISGNITYANLAAEKILGLTKDEITSRRYDAPLWDSTDIDGKPFPNEKQPFSIIKKTRRPAYDIQHAIAWPDGRRVILSINASPMKDDSGIFSGMVASIEDITERKEAEEKIKALLQEKEIILKETHHRVKNNMNTVHGLLYLQAEELSDPVSKNIIQDAASRVQNMTVLFDKLYRSENLHEMNANHYIPSHVDEIVRIFDSSVPVKIDIHVEDIVLSAKNLSVLGIIINELITNSMKYAFDNVSEGLIHLSVTEKDKKATVIYSDNGPGIPESVNFDSSTGFGMQLINMLVKQIGGTCEIARDRGAEFAIQFEV